MTRCCVAVAGLLAAAAAAGPAPAGAAELDPDRASRWILPHPDFYDVEARGERAWAVGYWGNVRRSTDGGETWEPVRTPVQTILYSVSFADARHGWAVGAFGTVLRTDDGGRSWTRQEVMLEDEFGDRVPLDSHLFGVSAVSLDEAWAVGDLGIVLHVLDGETWQQVPIDAEVFPDEYFPARIFNAVHFTSPERGWITGEFATILRTFDRGATWIGERNVEQASEELYLFDLTASRRSLPEEGLATAEARDPSDGAPPGAAAGSVADASAVREAQDGATAGGGPGAAAEGGEAAGAGSPRNAALPRDGAGAVVGLGGSVFATNDGGAAWEARPAPTDAGLFGIGASGYSTTVAGDRGELYVSMDRGRSWINPERPKLFTWLRGVAYAGDRRVFVAGERGIILRSEDGGASFEQVLGPPPLEAAMPAAPGAPPEEPPSPGPPAGG